MFKRVNRLCSESFKVQVAYQLNLHSNQNSFKMKKYTLFLFVLLSLIKTNISLSQIITINEIQSSNTYIIADESGNYEDWIELYNNGFDPNSISRGLSQLRYGMPNLIIQEANELYRLNRHYSAGCRMQVSQYYL